jgi:phosphatidylinositol-3-phosphatase
MRLRWLAGILAAAAIGTAPADAATPHLNHIFIVSLENESMSSSFGANSPIPYLAQNLRSQGAFLPNYYAIAHSSLPNYLAMISGQAPNSSTQGNCGTFTDFTPGTPTSDGQVIGSGCVYPRSVMTVANQLESAGLSWRGYMQDMANSVGAGAPPTCRRPAIGGIDTTHDARLTDQYATRHNPFVYFHSIIDQPTCAANVVDLSRLYPDLASEATTPSYAFISPDSCNDGHDTPCIDGGPGGMAQANSFLQGLVPWITASPGYRNRGLLIILFDEAESDSSACCNEQPGPNTTDPGGGGPSGPGGGRVGAVLLSPCIRAGTVINDAYNHYGLLRTIEDNFGLAHLGFAGQAGLQGLDGRTLNNPTCRPAIKLTMRPKRPPAGRRTRVKFLATSGFSHCTAGVEIRFAGRKVKTNSYGRARLKLKLQKGKHRAVATAQGCTAGQARLRALNRP